MMNYQATARVIGMLCMGMTLALATAILTTVSWFSNGADVAEVRQLAIQPLAMFAVGVGIRFVGSTLMREVQRAWGIMFGDVIATLIGVLAFAVVASVQDSTKSVVLAAIIMIVAAIPVAAVASLVSTGISRSRPLLRATSVASLFLLGVAVAVQGTAYWPAPWQ